MRENRKVMSPVATDDAASITWALNVGSGGRPLTDANSSAVSAVQYSGMPASGRPMP